MKNRTNEGFQMIHDIIKLRWVPEIIGTLASGYTNYNDILHRIDGLSNTELNRKLAVLLEKNAISKIDQHPRAGYVLSQFGEDLDHVFKHFEEMSEKYSQ